MFLFFNCDRILLEITRNIQEINATYCHLAPVLPGSYWHATDFVLKGMDDTLYFLSDSQNTSFTECGTFKRQTVFRY